MSLTINKTTDVVDALRKIHYMLVNGVSRHEKGCYIVADDFIIFDVGTMDWVQTVHDAIGWQRGAPHDDNLFGVWFMLKQAKEAGHLSLHASVCLRDCLADILRGNNEVRSETRFERTCSTCRFWQPDPDCVKGAETGRCQYSIDLSRGTSEVFPRLTRSTQCLATSSCSCWAGRMPAPVKDNESMPRPDKEKLPSSHPTGIGIGCTSPEKDTGQQEKPMPNKKVLTSSRERWVSFVYTLLDDGHLTINELDYIARNSVSLPPRDSESNDVASDYLDFAEAVVKHIEEGDEESKDYISIGACWASCICDLLDRDTTNELKLAHLIKEFTRASYEMCSLSDRALLSLAEDIVECIVASND